MDFSNAFRQSSQIRAEAIGYSWNNNEHGRTAGKYDLVIDGSGGQKSNYWRSIMTA